jgi:glucose-1-phosphate thymidylyltransferase
MVCYPLSVLMLAGITDVLLISTREDLTNFRRLLGDGSHLGLAIDYATQPQPNGLAEALAIGQDFVGSHDVALVLGDNIFYGQGFSTLLQRALATLEGCVPFGYPVSEPERCGVGEANAAGRLLSIEEKLASSGYGHYVVAIAAGAMTTG